MVRLNDSLSLFSKLSLRKIRNASNIYQSYHYAKIIGSPEITGLPISLAIEPTTSCNLRCPECPSGLRSFTRATGMLSPDLFKKVIDELSDTLIWLTFYFQGEPFLHSRFLEMVNTASQKRIYTSTSTNGHYLNDENARRTVESGLDRLIISIDGVTQESYESYRIGGNLSKVIEGTKNVLQWKKKLKSRTPHVVFQFLVVRPNEHQIPQVRKLAHQLGVDEVVFKSAQVYDYKNGSDLIPENSKYARYRKNSDGTYRIKNKLLNHCWKMWHSCVITWDGKVVPCCFDKDASHVLGDVSKDSFESIWMGEKYKSFRASLLKSRSEIEICTNCTEGTSIVMN